METGFFLALLKNRNTHRTEAHRRHKEPSPVTKSAPRYIHLCPAQPDSGVRRVPGIGLKGESIDASISGPDEHTAVTGDGPVHRVRDLARLMSRPDVRFAESYDWLRLDMKHNFGRDDLKMNVSYDPPRVEVKLGNCVIVDVARANIGVAYREATVRTDRFAKLIRRPA